MAGESKKSMMGFGGGERSNGPVSQCGRRDGHGYTSERNAGYLKDLIEVDFRKCLTIIF